MTSDMLIPRLCDILSRAQDARDSALRLKDTATVERIDRMVRDKLPNARLRWELGTLLVTSPSGNTYHVTRAGCDCLNAQRCGKRQCWHCMTYQLLIDLFETEAETRDQEAERPPLGQRLTVARRCYIYL